DHHGGQGEQQERVHDEPAGFDKVNDAGHPLSLLRVRGGKRTRVPLPTRVCQKFPKADNRIRRPCWKRVPLKPELKLMMSRRSSRFSTLSATPPWFLAKRRGPEESVMLTRARTLRWS